MFKLFEKEVEGRIYFEVENVKDDLENLFDVSIEHVREIQSILTRESVTNFVRFHVTKKIPENIKDNVKLNIVTDLMEIKGRGNVRFVIEFRALESTYNKITKLPWVSKSNKG